MLTVTFYILDVLSYSKKHNIYTTKNSDLYKYDTRRKENLHGQNYNTASSRIIVTVVTFMNVNKLID
jgi:hypothetical protein